MNRIGKQSDLRLFYKNHKLFLSPILADSVQCICLFFLCLIPGVLLMVVVWRK